MLFLEPDGVPVDGGVVGQSLTNQIAVSNTSTVAGAGQGDGIGVGEETALHVADGKQSADGIILRVKYLRVLVNAQTIGKCQQPRRNIAGIEGSVLYRAQEALGHTEVGIFASIAETVVALDGFGQVLSGNADLPGKLFEGVRRDETAILSSRGNFLIKSVDE